MIRFLICHGLQVTFPWPAARAFPILQDFMQKEQVSRKYTRKFFKSLHIVCQCLRVELYFEGRHA